MFRRLCAEVLGVSSLLTCGVGEELLNVREIRLPRTIQEVSSSAPRPRDIFTTWAPTLGQLLGLVHHTIFDRL
jgi:hypothetical protein